MKRTNQEYLLLVLSAFATLIITPFAMIRFMQNEWLIATVDTIIALGMAAIFIFVCFFRKVEIPSLVLAFFSVFSVIASIYTKGVVNVYWLYPAIVAVYYLLTPQRAIIIASCTIILVLPILFRGFDSIVFFSVVSTILMTSIFGFFFSKSVRDQHQQLLKLATKDSLTGVGNRRALTDKLLEITINQEKKFATVSLIMLDLDYFKEINDEYGHLMGDQILQKITEIIENCTGMTDTLYRFGGEEFIIVPLALDLQQTQKLAEQLRIRVEKNPLLAQKQVTISLGIACHEHAESSDDWLKRADDALYQAKKTGRNRVCMAS